MTAQQNKIDLKMSERAPLQGARLVGPADPNERMEVTVVLRRGPESANSFPSLAELGGKLPSEKRHLSRAEFAAAHGGHPDDVALLRAFAAQNNLQVVEENLARRSVVLSGTVRAFSQAFDVALSLFNHPSGSYRGRTGPVRIPKELEGIIHGVFGLDNRRQAAPHFRRRRELSGAAKPHTAASSSFTPLQVAQAYNFPLTLDGSGQTIAIIELGGGYQTQDLSDFFNGLSLGTPQVIPVSVDGAANAPTGDPNGPDGEVALDVEVAGAVAPKARIGVYFAPNTDRGFLDAITTAIHDTALSPSVISISWGSAEAGWTEQAMAAFDAAFQDAAAMGVTVCVASGDNGASDGVNDGELHVDFPASSPHVIACGGTKLVASGSSISGEVVWNELSGGGGATGGGVSRIFALPDWQVDSNIPAAPTNFQGRGVPDIAADADPTTGYDVQVDGRTGVFGGTSAVAPLAAGLIALINQQLASEQNGQTLGYLNPLLYSAHLQSALGDVTEGDNDGYMAGPGWDACTGLGSPNGTAMLSTLTGQGQPVAQVRTSTAQVS